MGVLSTYPVALSHNIVTLAASGGISLDTTGTQLSLLDGSPSIAFSGAPVNCTINSCPNPGTGEHRYNRRQLPLFASEAASGWIEGMRASQHVHMC